VSMKRKIGRYLGDLLVGGLGDLEGALLPGWEKPGKVGEVTEEGLAGGHQEPRHLLLDELRVLKSCR
jgi:hypothetical protein